MNLLNFEPVIRFSAFAGVLIIMAILEMASPMRRLKASRYPRWLGNLGLVALNSIALRLLLPLQAVGAALLAGDRGWGLFNILDWPAWVEGLITIVLLDLAVYLQHVVFHAVPVLWRLHMVHHADPDIDVTTGMRNRDPGPRGRCTAHRQNTAEYVANIDLSHALIHGRQIAGSRIDRSIVAERAATNSASSVEFDGTAGEIRCIAAEIVADLAEAIGSKQAGFISDHGHRPRSLNLAQNNMARRLQCNRPID